MNASKFSPEDPKLTAYVLGELDAAEQAEVEARLRDDPEARAAVESIRATTQWIEGALAQEPLPEIEPPRAVAEAAAADPYRQPKAKILNFPRFYFVAGTLAAACFAVMVALHQPAPKPMLEKQYMALELPTAKPAEEPAVAAMAMPAEDGSALADASTAEVRQEHVPAKVEFPTTVQSGAMPPPLGRPAPLTLSARGDYGAAAPPKLIDANGTSVDAEGVVKLAPFEVKEEKDYGYLRTNSVTATRIGMEVQPVTGGMMLGASSSNVRKSTSSEAERSRAIASAQASMAQKAAMKIVGSWTDIDASGAAPGAESNTEAYAHLPENPFLTVVENPLSTFSIDVDTASYANVRRMLNAGQRPPAGAVRIEELVNYFPYHYAAPVGNAPFAASMEVAEAPWAPAHRLVRIGLKGREVSVAARPAANLVFLLDVSGSMNQANKLPLVKESLRLLVGKLRQDDRVAIVTYAGNSGLALASTPVRRAAEILAAVDLLTPGGSTNGAMGIQLAYDIAKANFVGGGINRVILCTDGDFNVGTTSESDLVQLIEEKAQSKVFLTVLGFGRGNLKDSVMEKLADKGNGNYGYIDSRREAEKLLVEQVNGTLVTIAKDVKLQVEFNPAQVAAYRLIGYENRMLKKEDFNNDKIDAGEIGAGHTVTALYELVPAGAAVPQVSTVDALKYQVVETPRAKIQTPNNQELLTLKVRYKEPAGDVSSKLEFPLTDGGASFEEASADFKLAAAVASFGMILRDSAHKGTATFATVTEWAQAGIEDDAGGYRSEFLGLVSKAGQIVQ